MAGAGETWASPLARTFARSCQLMMTGHEESFKDTPRLSTLQGLLLLLKAREASPTQGYYYRSWMSVVTMVAIAKDLKLHEHLEAHRSGGSCGSQTYDCLVKSRVWHCLYVVELMIGGPQGDWCFHSAPTRIPADLAQKVGPTSGSRTTRSTLTRSILGWNPVTRSITFRNSTASSCAPYKESELRSGSTTTARSGISRRRR